MSDHDAGSMFEVRTPANLNFGFAGIMITLIAVMAIAMKRIFGYLAHYVDGTPFRNLLPAFEKELMIIGFTAFLFKIYLYSPLISQQPELIIALEFADTIIPIFSILTCLLGLLLLIVCVKICDNWSKASRVGLYELLDSFYHYYDSSNSLRARINNTLIMYYSGLQARVEFRIFQNIFCEQFHLPTNSFSFDEYMELQFEKLIIDLIEITPLTWIVFGIAFLVLWLRSLVLVFGVLPDCGEDHSCLANNGATCTFLSTGLLLVTITLMAMGSRKYLMDVLRYHGIESVDMYPAYILYLGTNLKKKQESARADGEKLKELASSQHVRFSHKNFAAIHPSVKDEAVSIRIASDKNADQQVKKQFDSRRHSVGIKRRSLLLDMPKRDSFREFVECIKSDTADENDNGPGKEKGRDGIGISVSSSIRSYMLVLQNDTANHGPLSSKLDEKFLMYMNSNLRMQSSRTSPLVRRKSLQHVEHSIRDTIFTASSVLLSDDCLPSSDKATSKVNFEKQPMHSTVDSDAFNSIRGGISPIDTFTCGNNDLEENRRLEVPPTPTFEWISEKFSQKGLLAASCKMGDHGMKKKPIFLFSQKIYFGFVKFLFMNITIHWTYCVMELLPDSAVIWSKKLCLLFLIVACLRVFIWLIRCALIIRVMETLDKETLLQVVEEAEGTRALEEEIRAKVLQFIMDIRSQMWPDADPVGGDSKGSGSESLSRRVELQQLFNRIDKRGRGLLTRNELREFFSSLRITFSRRKWKQVFRRMDRNQEDPNKISFLEFYLFLFPEDSEAIQEEHRRLNSVQERARRQSSAHMSALKSRRRTRPISVRNVLKTSFELASQFVNALLFDRSSDDINSEAGQSYDDNDNDNDNDGDIAQEDLDMSKAVFVRDNSAMKSLNEVTSLYDSNLSKEDIPARSKDSRNNNNNGSQSENNMISLRIESSKAHEHVEDDLVQDIYEC